MNQYDELDLVAMEILKTLLAYSFEDVQKILKKTEVNVASTFFCILDETGFKAVIEDIKKEIG